jgi:hypothetical protein
MDVVVLCELLYLLLLNLPLRGIYLVAYYEDATLRAVVILQFFVPVGAYILG